MIDRSFACYGKNQSLQDEGVNGSRIRGPLTFLLDGHLISNQVEGFS
ncbi:hypothetical protein Aaci_1139 [Alicyclobacillus acidocaldarius subsp. acidocaldarius DSM 446]|uniref:Uncharacterized protein n=1 Tax=Alicyclobacillus acidocaldarius subsp. acidocaldarius (strain ATCC 27009 / DSM 446 / BCRC 14685 / JCM 5260 / KCTC 1825 / NBRC 15652 / NCIMB 11725 / NRRL B-14509 / 104-IA) TaxID=521098 RepID=C8WVQ0_ALIAD|nr:hypothetical protein Aaci_1139 [Alicyclobacillus acidocaldarius subsp. acidocaldarius DSM 446]